MYCPRCGTHASAEKSRCPECTWLLSKSYTDDHEFSEEIVLQPPDPPGKGDAYRGYTAWPNTLADVTQGANGGKPRQTSLWTDRMSAALPRRFRRRERWETLGNTAVATMPEEARWAEPARVEYIQLPLAQSTFDFSGPDDDGEQLAARLGASIGQRMQAGALDGLVIASAAGLFFGLFGLLSGGLGLARKDLLVYLGAFFAIASVYYVIFTLSRGATPGMQLRGLRAVTFEGRPLGFHHRLWRSFGYVVSTGSLLLGFLWAAVDEKRLTWHDYISGTFVTDRGDL